MKDTILNYLSTTASTLDVKEILLNFLVATVIGILIFVSYRLTHSRAIYSAKFNVSLLMMAVITTLVMSVIGNNVALSLGMVGALSIIRFRTAIKDVRDTVYIFWCIAVGISCGVSEYLLAGIGSAAIFVGLLILGAVQNNEVYLLVVRAARSTETEVITAISTCFQGNEKMKVNNSTESTLELIYEVPSKDVEKKKRGLDVIEKLYEIEGVTMVNLVCQADETSR